MYTIKINGATYPKVTKFRTSESKLGQRLIIKQANGVKTSLLIKDIERLEIERILNEGMGPNERNNDI